MENKDICNKIFTLKNEMSSITPDVWTSLYKKLAEEISKNLLHELSDLPSPKGKLLTERKNEMIEKINKNKSNKIGA